MILLIGPAVAVVGLVAVFFVLRHKSVENRSMYSARRSQIEHKVRAARQRTLAPLRHSEKASGDEEASAPAPPLTYEPSAYSSPPVAPPTGRTQAPAQQQWDAGPTAPAPSPPPFATPAPLYEPPTFEPTPPPYQAPPPGEPAWTPSPPTPKPAEPEPATPAAAATTSAGSGASWSVVGETKGMAEPEPATKKKSKGDAQTPWSLASGVVPSEDADDAPRKPSAALAVAQYAVLVVGLVMVLIGVVVMVANQHGA
jgi:uncharacterized integral membrane protein